LVRIEAISQPEGNYSEFYGDVEVFVNNEGDNGEIADFSFVLVYEANTWHNGFFHAYDEGFTISEIIGQEGNFVKFRATLWENDQCCAPAPPYGQGPNPPDGIPGVESRYYEYDSTDGWGWRNKVLLPDILTVDWFDNGGSHNIVDVDFTVVPIPVG
jgi:hypothetical protein